MSYGFTRLFVADPVFSANGYVLRSLVRYPATAGLAYEKVTPESGAPYMRCTGIGSVTDAGRLVIADTVDGLRVREIGDNAFANSTAEEVVIPAGITTISDSAFRNCPNLYKVIFENNSQLTSVGSYAFDGGVIKKCICITNFDAWCMTSFGESVYNYYYSTLLVNGKMLAGDIVIPDGVTTICPYIIGNNDSITSITIPASVTSIGSSAFSGCRGLKSVTFGENSQLTSIGDYAFYNCEALKSGPVTFVDNRQLTSIGSYAFYGCKSLTRITIPASVTRIDSRAFEGCYKLIEIYNLSALNIQAGNSDYGYVGYYAKNVYKTTWGSKFSTDSNGFVFYTDTSNVWLIDYRGVGGAIALPEKHKGRSYELYTYALSYQSSITSIIIPEGMTSIGEYAFYNCTNVISVTIPKSLTSVGTDPFSGCRSLNDVYITDLVAWCNISWADDSGIGQETNLYLNGVLVTDLTIPETVTSIHPYMFNGIASLLTLTIPDSVTYIAESSFIDCVNLMNLTLPYTGESATDYETAMLDLRFCYDSLHTIVLTRGTTDPDGRQVIPAYSFELLSSVVSITLPDNISLIDGGAFYECTNLTDLEIPASVTEIYGYVFEYCESLTSLRFAGTVEQWHNITKPDDWNYNSSITQVVCSDGTITL